MNAFWEHHAGSIRFGYSCFDRVLLNAVIPVVQSPVNIVWFLRERRGVPILSRSYSGYVKDIEGTDSDLRPDWCRSKAREVAFSDDISSLCETVRPTPVVDYWQALSHKLCTGSRLVPTDSTHGILFLTFRELSVAPARGAVLPRFVNESLDGFVPRNRFAVLKKKSCCQKSGRSHTPESTNL